MHGYLRVTEVCHLGLAGVGELAVVALPECALDPTTPTANYYYTHTDKNTHR